MIGRKVQRLEVVVVVFDFGTFGNREPDGAEKVFHPLNAAGYGVDTSTLDVPARQGDIDGLLRQLR